MAVPGEPSSDTPASVWARHRPAEPLGKQRPTRLSSHTGNDAYLASSGLVQRLARNRQLVEARVPRVAEAPDSELVIVIRENWKDRTASDYRPGDIAAVGVMLVIGFAGTFLLARERGRGSTDSEASVGMDSP